MDETMEEGPFMSIVNTNKLRGDELQNFLDCLEEIDRIELKRKSKRVKRSAKNSLRKFQSQPQIPQAAAIEAWNPNKTAIGSAFDANVTDSPSRSVNVSLSDTFSSEQLQEIFAYFDEDVMTAELYTDDSQDELDADDDTTNVKNVAASTPIKMCSKKAPVEVTTKMAMKPAPRAPAEVATEVPTKMAPAKWSAKKNPPILTSSKPIITAAQPKQFSIKAEPLANGNGGPIERENDILEIIKQFNGFELSNANATQNVGDGKKDFKFVVETNNIRRHVNAKRNEPKRADRMSTYSETSTVLLSDSESECGGCKPFDLVDCGSIRQRVAFFNDHSSSERSSSESPLAYALSSDEEDTKQKFEQTRAYFEKFFSDHQSAESDAVHTKPTPLKPILKKSEPNDGANSPDSVGPGDKLNAVRTYVQTKYFLERIQRLALAFSKLDENRMSTMNLKRLRNFLVFIRDCTKQCNQICDNIGGNLLTDVERNVMSAEELLFSALKMAQIQQVNSLC